MVLLWAFNFIIAKYALREFGALALAALRIQLAAVLVTVIYTARRGLAGWRCLTRADIGWFVLLGILGVALNQGLFVVGLKYTTVAHSALIIAAGPLHVLWMSRVAGIEHITAKKLIGMLIAFSGVVVLASEYGFSRASLTWRGDLITVCCSLSFSAYAVLGKKVARRYDSLAMNQFTFLVGALVLLPLAVREVISMDAAAISWRGWAAMVYMAAGASVAAYLIFYWALRRIRPSQLATFTYLQPPLATILAAIFLGEAITHHLLIGGPLVLGGVALAEIGWKRPAEDEAVFEG